MEVIVLDEEGMLLEQGSESPFGREWSNQQNQQGRGTTFPAITRVGPSNPKSSPPSCPGKLITCLMQSSGTEHYVAIHEYVATESRRLSCVMV